MTSASRLIADLLIRNYLILIKFGYSTKVEGNSGLAHVFGHFSVKSLQINADSKQHERLPNSFARTLLAAYMGPKIKDFRLPDGIPRN